MPTRKYEDTFLFTLENLVIVPRKNVFLSKNWFWLMSLPAWNYPYTISFWGDWGFCELVHSGEVSRGGSVTLAVFVGTGDR